MESAMEKIIREPLWQSIRLRDFCGQQREFCFLKRKHLQLGQLIEIVGESTRGPPTFVLLGYAATAKPCQVSSAPGCPQTMG